MRTLSAWFVVALLILVACQPVTPPQPAPVPSQPPQTAPANTFERNLTVYYLDVGQGDSELIVFPNRKTMLIDCGDQYHGKAVVSNLRDLGIDKIDILLVSNPNEEHLGGCLEVLMGLGASTVIENGQGADSTAYKNFLDFVQFTENYTVIRNTITNYSIDPSVGIDVLEAYTENGAFFEGLNDNSLAVKIKYLNNSFLFMGDCGEICEETFASSMIPPLPHLENINPAVPNATLIKTTTTPQSRPSAVKTPTDIINERIAAYNKAAGRQVLTPISIPEGANTPGGAGAQRKAFESAGEKITSPSYVTVQEAQAALAKEQEALLARAPAITIRQEAETRAQAEYMALMKKQRNYSYDEEIKANFLKVGNHGAFTISTKAFLEKVKPEIAIITVGRNNSQGYPTPETLMQLKNMSANIYRTDQNGTIIITTNGQEYSIKTEWN